MINVTLPAYVEGIRTRKDRTLGITIGTQELGPSDAAAVFELNQKCGWVMFSINPITEEDIPEEPAGEFKTDKTPGQRLRSVLFRLWEQEGSKGEFLDYYRIRMERLIERFKEKLA